MTLPNKQKGFTLLDVAILSYIFLCVAFPLGIGYIICHFIFKYW